MHQCTFRDLVPFDHLLTMMVVLERPSDYCAARFEGRRSSTGRATAL